jgi:Zn finger protein HypA/HybF involved in hydrogenase expression
MKCASTYDTFDEVEEEKKLRPCLRCDKQFLTTKYYRLCVGCRGVATRIAAGQVDSEEGRRRGD